MKHHVIRALASGIVILALTSCTNPGAQEPTMNTDEKTASQQFSQLMQRPDIDQAAARYDEMFRNVREQLAAKFPALRWKQTDQPGRAGCSQEFAAIDVSGRADAETRSFPIWTAPGNLPDSEWQQAAADVREIAQSYGFDTGKVTVKRHNDNEIVFRDQYRAALNFGSAVNTTLLVRTGCHLSAEARNRGSLAPLPSY
ncbi:putative LppA-like lipoprotein [Amycolatopsis sulphurea]|uniref:Putative LppA-like lipoprotein n=1 Tax=Amycolatopsis sulphurea TaxID=76022 RepID=A0A2A9FKD1_9PSEU|nr:LppA family lipoprotein [Amycolatopsis sulphurea]PFG51012.1 putative LppA-like lipoprotein [Amycolatopsis sulphurea]